MTEDTISIDIFPVEWVQSSKWRSRRYRVVAKSNGTVVCEESIPEGGGMVKLMMRRLVELGFGADTGIEFYRGDTLVFLRASLGDWVEYVRKRTDRKKSDDEEDDE